MLIPPSSSEIQQWVYKIWKIPAGVRVKEMNDEYFLFEFLSRSEAERIKMEKWMFNENEILLEWWSHVATCYRESCKAKHVCIKLMGFPSHLWSENIFRWIGNRFGGFLGMDDDTRSRHHLRRARICVKNSGCHFPTNVELFVNDLIFKVPL